MDIFVSCVPPTSTNRELTRILSGPLEHCGIRDYHVEKLGATPNALITVLDRFAGAKFLELYGSNAARHEKPRLRITYAGQLIRFSKGKTVPTELAVQSLVWESAKRSQNAPRPPPTVTSAERGPGNQFTIDSLECGTWDYVKDARSRTTNLAFISHFSDHRAGHILFGNKEARVILGDGSSLRCRVDLPYYDCDHILLGSQDSSSVSFTMNIAPKFYQMDLFETQSPLADLMRTLSIQPPTTGPGPQARGQPPKKVRLPAINPNHAHMTGCCFVYRVVLEDSRHLSALRSLLSKSKKKCSVLAVKTHSITPREPLTTSFRRLNHELTDQNRYGNRPFKLLFQIERLARNGCLPPDKVVGLLPRISKLHKTYGLDPILFALRKFARDMVLPGPEWQANDFSLRSLEDLLEGYAADYDAQAPDNPYELAKRFNHINLVHKVVITPSGLRLEGPEPEPTNRVLRKYSDNVDNFVRVIFTDEDGAPMRHDPRTDQSKIFHERFRKIMDDGFLMFARAFHFLGFSHSSLRSQSCWFMTPLVSREKSLLYATHVMRSLGDFSRIRVPAKCAARIGQNFTDTNTSVEVRESEVFSLEMMERNGRDFADGAGTISWALLQEVWKVYGTRRSLKPTALQIRFQGSKGMVSLDPRLPGRRLMIRPNMKKFEVPPSATSNLEICGAAFKPLPMILNRQFIKIFEDLGVSFSVFKSLQDKAMNRLRQMTRSAINTATFLTEVGTSKASGLPNLIRYLGHIGLDYHADHFLYSVVELAVVSELRDLKHRGRIPVEDGVTLYGIPDEYGVLRENEIFVVTEAPPEGGKRVLVKRNVIVTRSPALHPGDIQVVNAVDVHPDHPLRKLSNVVVFSKWGQRDLPSQLSGGDLDGDLYNVIWHEPMIPKKICMAADYPRTAPVELDRDVTSKDMSDFFVTFMETDLLGKLANDHMALADQSPRGTFDPNCIKLAELASTAVDYSKTGKPVTMKEIPRFPQFKPDFMAPDPRVVVSEKGFVDFEEEADQDDEAFDAIDVERKAARYYESKKTLGFLYRAIDERQFVKTMQKEHQAVISARKKQGIMPDLLRYAKLMCERYLVQYTQHKLFAQQLRMSYEESLANIMHWFEPTPRNPLTEAEVFAGQILGRQNGPRGKPLRDLNTTMRERFAIVAEHAMVCITKGDQAVAEVGDDLDLLYDAAYDDREFEALPRAIACLEVAMEESGYEDRRLGELKSFKYIAAAACLKELDRYRVTTFGSYSGLPAMDTLAGV